MPYYPTTATTDSTMPTMSIHHARIIMQDTRATSQSLESFDLYQLRHLPLILVLSPQPASLISFIIKALERSVRIDRRTRDETRKEGANRS